MMQPLPVLQNTKTGRLINVRGKSVLLSGRGCRMRVPSLICVCTAIDTVLSLVLELSSLSRHVLRVVACPATESTA